MPEPLSAVSPLDGRYADRTAPLREYVSESALMRARSKIEIEYLIALADVPATDLSLGEDERESLRDLYRTFDRDDADLIKRLETEGYGEYPATKHDVKAVEYFIRIRLPNGFETVGPWIHFGLTSEDVNNLAYRLLLDTALREVILPKLVDVRDVVGKMAREYRDLPMLARTHGQPATPTTFGKEMAVYAARLAKATPAVRGATADLSGKLGGASGTYAAHVTGFPDVDWRGFAREFVEGLGLEFTPLSTQINPCDDLADLFDALQGVNHVLIDLDRDMWLYVSDRYLGQETTSGETGSSTMPHKVNPIDFENGEGNLSKANADLSFLADYVTKSRLQRDLSDSTVKRNIGAALSHCLIGYTKTADGLATVVPNEQVMRDELDANPEVIAEAVQTILRREGLDDAYERVKDLTRGQRTSLEDFHALFDELDVDESVKDELRALTPAGYTGVASDLVEELRD